MEPAQTIIRKLGGEAVVSEITGTAYTAPYRWQHSRERGGTGGLIPQKHHPRLLAFAMAKGIALSPSEFLPAQTSPEPTESDGGCSTAMPPASRGIHKAFSTRASR